MNKIYELMYKNNKVLSFNREYEVLDFEADIKLPYGMQNDPNYIKIWMEERMNVKSRPNYDKLLQVYGLSMDSHILDIASTTYCTSFRDVYWLKLSTDNTTWEEVNPYTTHEEMLDVLLEGDITSGMKTKACAEFTYKGTTLKGYWKEDNALKVYKRYSSLSLFFREMFADSIRKFFSPLGLRYEVARKESTGKPRNYTSVYTNATEDFGFISLEEFLVNHEMEYTSATSLDILRILPVNLRPMYIKVRTVTYLLDSTKTLESRMNFYINNETQEVDDYYGTQGNSKCLMYNLNIDDKGIDDEEAEEAFRAYCESKNDYEHPNTESTEMIELLQLACKTVIEEIRESIVKLFEELGDPNFIKNMIGEEVFSEVSGFICPRAFERISMFMRERCIKLISEMNNMSNADCADTFALEEGQCLSREYDEEVEPEVEYDEDGCRQQE